MIPGLDVAFAGVTLDSAASNRSGTRYGPRQIRTESVMLRAFNKETGTYLQLFYCYQILGMSLVN